jgi:glutamine phosphoribosylpyrophosphate amidotransferase
MKIKSVITLVAASTLMMSAYSTMAGVTSNIRSDINSQQRGNNTATANTGSSRYGRYGSRPTQYNTATAQAGVGNIAISTKGTINSTINLRAKVNHQGSNNATASTPSGRYNNATASAGFGNIAIK